MLDSIKILVLNYSYEPLQFCSAKRGLVMVLCGRAENIECDGFVVRSATQSFPMPAVIRVLRIVKRNRKKPLSFSRRNILRRDNFTCQYCGITNHPLTVDHVMPKSRGGQSVWTNVVVACKPCNLKKGNRRLSEVGMELINKPNKPDFHFAHFSVPAGPQSYLQIWRKYLPRKIFFQTLMQ